MGGGGGGIFDYDLGGGGSGGMPPLVFSYSETASGAI